MAENNLINENSIIKENNPIIEPSVDENPTENAKKKNRPKFGWLVLSILLFAAAAGLMYVRKEVPTFAPFYSTKIYTIWQNTLGRFSDIFSFSLSEALLYSLPIILILDIIVIIISKKRRIWGLLKRIVLVTSLIAFLYAANCGVNYYNMPFIAAEQIPILKMPTTSDEHKAYEKLLIKFCEYISDEISKSSKQAENCLHRLELFTAFVYNLV